MTEFSGSKRVKLWGGRFIGSTDPVMEEFNASISYDKAMWKEDIQGSSAYAAALRKANLLTEQECLKLTENLQKIHDEWNSGTFSIKSGDEDIHTANERRLKELAGEVGGKVHTGRSRNDQVAVDMRMWLRGHVEQLSSYICNLVKVLLDRAAKEKEILMPGYTHLQRAQPIRWSHWLLSHMWPLVHDLERLQGVYSRINICPLGSGALAGNPFSVDRKSLAESLGFEAVSENSLHAVSDRDFVAEYLFWASLVSVHLSRIAEDLILFSTKEFGYVKLHDAYATGSSLMPQKKNPDSLELIRGKAGSVTGNLCGFMMVLKGLPSTYNKDLQEDKLKMFETAAVLKGVLQVLAGTVSTLKVDGSACWKALSEEMLATDVAYYLVKKGMPFRTAHEKAGEVVKLSEDHGCSFSALQLSDLQEISSLFSEDVTSVWDFEHSVEQYQAEGGTALSSLTSQIEKARKFLERYSVSKK